MRPLQNQIKLFKQHTTHRKPRKKKQSHTTLSISLEFVKQKRERMVDTNVSLELQQQNQNPSSLESLLHALDPISLILSQNSSNSDNPLPLKLTTQSFQSMERGPRYEAYSKLRESKKLRMMMNNNNNNNNSSIPGAEDEQIDFNFKQILSPPPPTKKQVKFQPNLTNSRKGFSSSTSILAQSVPDFSATLRKENRRPPVAKDLTPPPPASKNWSKVSAILSKSATNSGEKRNNNGLVGGGLMARKSYANVEELKGLSLAAAKAINGENRGGGRGIGTKKTILGYRQF